MADVTKEIVLEVGLKDSTAAGTTSAKTRLRELQKTLADMALAGQDGTKAFREMELGPWEGMSEAVRLCGWPAVLQRPEANVGD